jgi:hypothetical protein
VTDAGSADEVWSNRIMALVCEDLARYGVVLLMTGWWALSMRKSLGDDAALACIEAWADAPVPKFHKL